MTRNGIIAVIRLMALFYLILDITRLPTFVFEHTVRLNSTDRVALFIWLFLVPVILWTTAPWLSRFVSKPVDSPETGHAPSVRELLSMGIFLLGLYFLPAALTTTVSHLWMFLNPGPALSGDQLWQFSSSLRQGLITGTIQLIICLLFLFSPRHVVSLYDKYGSPKG